MDFEKEYKEAVERAEKSGIDKATLDYIFPKFNVECGEGWIKNQIVYAINQLNVCDDTKEKCLAWFYKQCIVRENVKTMKGEMVPMATMDQFEAVLADEWKKYNDRGAAAVDALEDNTQELAFAKGFYRGWKYKCDTNNN